MYLCMFLYVYSLFLYLAEAFPCLLVLMVSNLIDSLLFTFHQLLTSACH